MSLSLFPFFRLFFLVVMFFFFGVRPRDVRTQQEGGGRAAERGEPDVHPCGWFYLVPPRWWLGRRRNRGAKCVVSNSRPCPSWCALPKLTSWWWNCQSLEIDVVLNLMDWGWMINGWPMMIHEVMVVDEFDDGGGGYYIDFSEVGLILFDFTWWSCSFWLLVLNVELDLLGITKMMLDGSKSNSRWCFSTPSVLKSGSFCMFVSDCIRYWYHVDELVGLSVLLQWQGETTFSEARRQTRWYLFMFFVCKIWWLFDR